MPDTNDSNARTDNESTEDPNKNQQRLSREHTGLRTLQNHFDWQAVYRALHCPVPDGGEAPDQTNESHGGQLVALLEEHPDSTVSDNGGFSATASAMLDVLAEMDIPPEDRSHRESLSAISSPARAISLNKVHNPEKTHEPASVQIVATPEELQAHVAAHIEWAIERKIERGELVRTKGGEP